jgi:beta-lactamase regulating signal transducer with metallopeptidase domain/uncharacterized GH25 family protein
MSALDVWHPGDATVLAALEVLGLITVFVGLGWLGERFLASRRAASRAALWLLVLAAVLLTPALVLLGRHLPWRVAILATAKSAAHNPDAPLPESPPTAVPDQEEVASQPASSEGVMRPEAAPPRRDLEPADSPAVAPAVRPGPARRVESLAEGDEAPAPPAPDPSRAVTVLALVAWVGGSAWLACRLLHGSLQVRRLWRHLRPLDRVRWGEELRAAGDFLPVSRLPDVYLCPDVRSPLVAGLFHPWVVLPESLPEHAPGCLLALLVHEFAHVARRDPWARLLQRLATVLFWVHPLVYLLNRRLDQAREEVCDNHVLACTDAPTYAEILLAITRACYPNPRPRGYLNMFSRDYPLERRVVDLLEERRDRSTRLPAPQRAALLTAFALVLAAGASVGFSPAAGGPQPAAKEPPSSAEEAKPESTGGVKLTGRVLYAADGKPAAGAIVWAAKQTHSPLVRREVVADSNGLYVLDLSPGVWFLWARRGTQGGEGEDQHGAIEIVAGQAHTPVDIRLEERGTFRGRLLEAESGKPIPGGKLFLDAGLVLAADAAGRFQVGGLARTHHEAFVVAPGRLRMRVLFDTTARDDTELDVSVPRGGRIIGRVTDADGKPIPGAWVGRATSGTFTSINALYEACDSEGRFEYHGVTPDQSTGLKAVAPGYAEEYRRAVGPPAGGEPLVMNFRPRPKPGTPAGDRLPDAEKRRAVSGVVLGPDGKPAPAVVVRWGFQPFVGTTQTRTDAAGRFRLTVPDKENLLAVLPSHFEPDFQPVAAGGDKKVTVTLRQGQTARGQVLDDAGKPIANVLVVAVTACPNPRFCNPYWLTESAVYTDPAGRFEMKGVPRGAQFDFLKRGLSELRNQELDLTRADNTVKMLYGGALSGRVVDRDGKPIRNFRVLVNFPRERKEGDQTAGFFAGYTGIGVRFTSADGSFVLTDVGAGSVYRVKVIAEGHGEAVADRMTALALNQVRNARPVTLRAGSPVELRVRAVAAGDKPIPEARVTLVNGAPDLDKVFAWGYHDASWEDMIRARTGPDGKVTFPALSFAGATLLVRAPGFARHRVGWRDGAKELTCQLAKEARIAGEVLDAAGKPVKEYRVSVSNGEDQIAASVDADDQGRFRIDELPAGTWQLEVRGPDGRAVLHQEKVKLEAGETKELKVKTKE